MEFETNSQPDNDARRLAESKKLTLNPLHGDIAPEPLPDGEAVSRHVNGPAIGNISTDTEQSAATVKPSRGLLDSQEQTNRRGATGIVVISAVAAGAIVAVTFFVIFR